MLLVAVMKIVKFWPAAARVDDMSRVDELVVPEASVTVRGLSVTLTGFCVKLDPPTTIM